MPIGVSNNVVNNMTENTSINCIVNQTNKNNNMSNVNPNIKQIKHDTLKDNKFVRQTRRNNNKVYDKKVENMHNDSYEKEGACKIYSIVIKDIIVNSYVTDDPQKQSLWCTDTKRHTYYIKDITHDGIPLWIKDEQGKIVIKRVIAPLVEFNKEKLKEYVKFIKTFDVVNNLKDMAKALKIELDNIKQTYGDHYTFSGKNIEYYKNIVDDIITNNSVICVDQTLSNLCTELNCQRILEKFNDNAKALSNKLNILDNIIKCMEDENFFDMILKELSPYFDINKGKKKGTQKLEILQM